MIQFHSHSSRRSLSTKRRVLLALPYWVDRVVSDRQDPDQPPAAGARGGHGLSVFSLRLHYSLNSLSIPLGNACSSPLLLSCFRFTNECHNRTRTLYSVLPVALGSRPLSRIASTRALSYHSHPIPHHTSHCLPLLHLHTHGLRN